jgi:DNA polymerase II large subunit
MQVSPALHTYFDTLEKGLEEAIAVSQSARKRGLDPRTEVEIPIASDLADRVEALLGYKGVAARLRELEQQMSREEAALKIGDDFIARAFGETSPEEVLDHAIRTAMALLTEGVVAAPTEGIGKVGLGTNDDGTRYLKIYYAGPIRSAGGTAQALSVLVGDYVRRGLGLNRYIPRPKEVERYIEEIRLYNSIVNLQYLPTEDELRLIINNCPVCIDGEPTEKQEVGGYRNLERVETNTVRGGMALVVAEGLALKAPKIQKNVRKMRIEGWEWLDQLISGSTKEGDEAETGKEVIKPKYKYIQDLIGGRPVFSYPMRKGGFRLRYGRSRNTGLAAAGINPATMHILGDFLAVGTQMKIERPGKAAGITPVDTIEGPTVRLTNGDVLRIDDKDQAESLMDQVDQIIDVGEILISFGEFLENNHLLVPSAYCEEWWLMEGGTRTPRTELEAVEMALGGAYLHPRYTYLWDDLTCEEIRILSDAIAKNGVMTEGRLHLPLEEENKALLEELLVPHIVREGKIIVEEPLVLLACAGLTLQLKPRNQWQTASTDDPLSLVMHLSGFKMRSRAGTRIGGRMGRPGKSKQREMRPPPHSLFPVGDAGGSRRSFQEACQYTPHHNAQTGVIMAEVGVRRCPVCGKESFKNRCECGGHTEPVYRCPRCGRELQSDRCPACKVQGTSGHAIPIDVKAEYLKALAGLGMRENGVKLVKGVKGLISRERCVEAIEKGILRARHELFVFKDGTIRYDMIDLPVTHFTSREIQTPIGRLIELGYTNDIAGVPLTDEDQILELKPQDILVSEDCGNWLVRVASFIDDALQKIYALEPYYNATSREDLVGHLLIGLAPHTSAGVLARLIGFSQANVGYGHPYFHAAKRRNCFHGDTQVSVYDGKEWRTYPISQFVVENFDVSRPEIDRMGTYWSDPQKPFFTHAINPHGTIQLRRITAVSVHPSPDTLLTITTRRGKRITVTPDHAMMVCGLTYIRKIRALELKEGDCVPLFEGATMIPDTIASIETVQSAEEYVYCLTVAEDHTLAANGIFTGQCDGDEDCVMLLIDGLINFSRAFLPETRGGSMDAPLVLTSRIDPAEIDKESHNVDACASYPLELYLSALEYVHPKDIARNIDHVELRLGTPRQYEGIMFTTPTSDISAGPAESTYTILATMIEKLDAELELAKKIRAVDEDDVAERVLNTHFIRDLMGNLSAFSKQKLRCTKCNAKYRRMPIAGKCTRCGGNIIATVHEGSVKKYLEMSLRICEEYDVSEYTRQRVKVLDMAIESTFGTPKEQQMGLADFL